MNFRPGHVDLAINVPFVITAIRTIALGPYRFGDGLGGFAVPLRAYLRR